MRKPKDLDIASVIRLRLTEAVKTSGRTQVEIAKDACITASTLSDYLNKRTLPSIETFALLCRALDVSADYILGLDDD